MAEKQTLSIEHPPPPDSDWPSLIERAVDDVTRILRSEVQILRTSIGAALQRQISDAVALLAIVAIAIAGVLCVIFAAVFLLHQWLPLWQSFGVVGLFMLILAAVCNVTLRPRLHAHS
jgi:VIT1/CCC1 family predicted Fe2+/Mn2+ transporter